MRSVRKGALAIVAAILSSAVAAPAADLGGEKAAPRNFAALFSALEKADAIVEGAKDPKRVFYVFFDANCFYCHLTRKALRPYERVGLQVRWVPVAYQKESSVGRAAAVMQAYDRASALRENETHYRVETFEGGIAPATNPPAALVARLEANTRLMERFGVPGTPGIVWKDRSGKVRLKVGMPRLSQLSAMTGLPMQKNDDPALADFR